MTTPAFTQSDNSDITLHFLDDAEADQLTLARAWKAYADSEVARLTALAEAGDPEAWDLLNDAIQIADAAAAEVEELERDECQHEYVTDATGRRWFDGTGPDDNLSEPVTFCRKCGKERRASETESNFVELPL